MANNYFQFKKFTITQAQAAMKVTTDGCLFGAIVTFYQNHNIYSLLDIGTGTGLLSCMFSQENPQTKISAIDISPEAIADAEDNISKNDFKNITPILTSLQDFKPENLFDVIISNPPFYEHQLSTPDKLKSIAHHEGGLSLQELFTNAHRLLQSNGHFWVLLPYYRHDEAIGLGKQFGWNANQVFLAKQTPKHNYFRTIIQFSSNAEAKEVVEIIIKDQQNEYSAAFTALLKPYYLKL